MNISDWKVWLAGAITVLYLILAIAFVHDDRTSNSPGGWINLRGMVSLLVTFPVSLPLEALGRKLDFRSNVDMGAAVAITAGLVFAVLYGLCRFGQAIWQAIFTS